MEINGFNSRYDSLVHAGFMTSARLVIRASSRQAVSAITV